MDNLSSRNISYSEAMQTFSEEKEISSTKETPSTEEIPSAEKSEIETPLLPTSVPIQESQITEREQRLAALLQSTLTHGILCGAAASNLEIERPECADTFSDNTKLSFNLLSNHKEIESAIFHPGRGALPVILERKEDKLVLDLARDLTADEKAQIIRWRDERFGTPLPPRGSEMGQEIIKQLREMKHKVIIDAFMDTLSERAHESFLLVFKRDEMQFTTPDYQPNSDVERDIEGKLQRKKSYEDEELTCSEVRMTGNISPNGLHKILISERFRDKLGLDTEAEKKCLFIPSAQYTLPPNAEVIREYEALKQREVKVSCPDYLSALSNYWDEASFEQSELVVVTYAVRSPNPDSIVD